MRVVALASAALILGCAGAQPRRTDPIYALLIPNDRAIPEPTPENTRVIDVEAPEETTSTASVEERLERARRLYRDLAFRASLDELQQAQALLEEELRSENAMGLIDAILLVRALDEMALGNMSRARTALRQAAMLRPDRPALPPAEFSPEVRSEYAAVQETLDAEKTYSFSIEAAPDSTELTVDGRTFGAFPSSVPLHEGRHYVVLSAPKHVSEGRVVDIVDGAPNTLRVDLEPVSNDQLMGELGELDAATFAALENASRLPLAKAANQDVPVHIGSEGTGWKANLLDRESGSIQLTAASANARFELAVPELVDSLRDDQEPKPLVRKWWFWTVIGVAVVGTSLGLYFGLRNPPETQLVIR